ncbi:hypothetical protein DB30_03480 [Enhygromyxa salina]|uniref:Uncharacterized protein n=1 Tax=Enhygromyxa salina TaxID=215803 RepID=A0A0C2DC57_9BACT|nr:hypothetical protein DB30_03480 [Enhygromyxa salina]
MLSWTPATQNPASIVHFAMHGSLIAHRHCARCDARLPRTRSLASLPRWAGSSVRNGMWVASKRARNSVGIPLTLYAWRIERGAVESQVGSHSLARCAGVVLLQFRDGAV